jgi:L-2-hydroxyglutarate oxidase LhgO
MDTNITIIGAGVIGLAIAAKLSEKFSGIFVLEKNLKFGQETSSRNSEVIHSGIYYPTNSLKASLCVKGNKMLYEYCIKKNINHKKIGKLVVATDSQEEAILQKVFTQSRTNGVRDGIMLSKEEILELEPNVLCKSAIYFPSTGIVDSHGLMKQLETDAIINQISLAYNSEVVGIEKIDNGYKITVKEENGTYSFTTKIVINAAGLNSDTIARISNTFEPLYQLYYWKGEYFSVSNQKNALIQHLVYPVPHENNTGLGIHATLDLDGRLKLGPDATFLNDRITNYSVDKSKQESFYNAVRRYLPFIEMEDLNPDQSGIRPKLQKPGDSVRDFIIKDEHEKGHPNFINLIGIESPGLTSCLAIAEMVSGFDVFRG